MTQQRVAIPTRKCEQCGKPYQPKQDYQKYCKATCRVIAWAKRQ